MSSGWVGEEGAGLVQPLTMGTCSAWHATVLHAEICGHALQVQVTHALQHTHQRGLRALLSACTNSWRTTQH